MNNVTTSRKRFRKIIRQANEAAANGEHDKAARLYEEYLQHAPQDPQVLFNLGALRQQAGSKAKDYATMHGLFVESIEFYSRAIESPHADIETKADALNNHGLIMLKLGFPDKAKIAFHFAMQLKPEHRAARLNFADVLVWEGEYDAADREFHEIIAMDHNSAGAQFSRSMVLLTLGEIRRGFREYRSRFNVRSFPSKMLATAKPLWDGEDLNGKTLIVTTEQGYGDQLQFIRYAGEIKDRWPLAKVLFACADNMHGIMAGVRGLDGCLPDHTSAAFIAPPFDYHAPLIHLPDILGTTIETIPGKTPYIAPQPDWAPFTLPASEKLKAGIVWAGSPRHGKDKWRSVEPEAFQPVIDAHSEWQFYSLQCGPRCEEVLRLQNIVSLAERITCWEDTAQAILQLDIVITVDTAVAHLAGALGKPVWILIGSSPDWRWMLGRADTPWYPTATLYRQPEKDDWKTPIAQINADLKQWNKP